MARSKSPARAKKTPTKKAPAKKAAAADPLEMISFITNGGTLSKVSECAGWPAERRRAPVPHTRR